MKRKSRMKLSLFARLLRQLLDDTDICTREEWALYLEVTPSAISQWVNDHTLPRPEKLLKVIEFIKAFRAMPARPILKRLESPLAKPTEVFSPLFGRKYRHVRTMDEYALIGLRNNFLARLNAVSVKDQGEILRAAITLCCKPNPEARGSKRSQQSKH